CKVAQMDADDRNLARHMPTFRTGEDGVRRLVRTVVGRVTVVPDASPASDRRRMYAEDDLQTHRQSRIYAHRHEKDLSQRQTYRHLDGRDPRSFQGDPRTVTL